MASNHHKCQLLFKYFYHLRRAPYKTRACLKLMNLFVEQGLRAPFEQLDAFCQQREVVENSLRTRHYANMALKVLKLWHSVAVQEKIARMFFKRKYLSALQDFIFEKNYIKPASIREHLLKRKVLSGLLAQRGKRWTKDRQSLITRAFLQKHRQARLRSVFNKLINNILVQKRKRIIMSTVVDFRRHSVQERVFRMWKVFHNEQRRKELMLQVANEFRQERIHAMIN
jgi:hypothetical protein